MSNRADLPCKPAFTSSRICRSLLAVLLAIPSLARCSETQRPCVVTGNPPNPPNPSLAVAENHSGRRNVDRDYLVIEYTAQTYSTAWYDYHHFPHPYQVLRNGSFLPVVYTREKIAVHVCGLHFMDQLTVTTSPLAVPEGGADIRGFTPTTALTSLSSTLDALQTAGASGGAVPVSGLGFSTTGSIGTITVSGVSPGTLSGDGKATYTGANVTLSGAEVAQYLYALKRNADDLVRSINQTVYLSQATLPGSIESIDKETDRIRGKVSDHSHASDATWNVAAYDEDITAMQGLAGQLTTLAASLSSLGFGTRAVALQNNYALLRGILDFETLGLNPKYCEKTLGKPGPQKAYVVPLSNTQIEELTDEQVRNLQTSDLEALSKKQLQKLTKKEMKDFDTEQISALMKERQTASNATDKPTCSPFEEEKFKESTLPMRPR